MSSKVQDHLGHMLNVQAEEGDITAMRCEDCGVDLEFTAGSARLVEREQSPLALDPLSPIVYRVPQSAFVSILPGCNDKPRSDEAEVVLRSQYDRLRKELVELVAEAAAVAGRQVLADPDDTRLRDAVRQARRALL